MLFSIATQLSQTHQNVEKNERRQYYYCSLFSSLCTILTFEPLEKWIKTHYNWSEHASYSYCAHSWCQQTNPLRKKNFPSGWKCYKTIGSYVSCVFINIWSTWEVWRALKKLEFLSATPRATLTHLLCSPNFLHASYLNERMLMYEPIVK